MTPFQRCRSVPSLVTALALSLGVASGPLLAQGAPEFTPLPPLIDVTFEGGTLESYVRTVSETAREKHGSTQNIVLSDAGLGSMIEVPPVALKSVRLETALDLVEHIAKPIDSTRDISVRSMMISKGAGQAVYLLDLRSKTRRPTARPPIKKSLEVISLEEAGLAPADPKEQMKSVESILTAIDTASMLAGGETMTIKYHPDTQILFAHGTEEQISLVLRIVETYRARTKLESRNDSRISVLQARLEESQAEVATLREHVEALTAALEAIQNKPKGRK